MIELKGAFCKDVKIFTDNVEESALSAIYDMANCNIFQYKKIRIMPDCHNGSGTVVGFSSTIDIEDEFETINPDYIGGDIGCSVSAIFFDKPMPDEFIPEFEHKIRKEIPFGNEINQKKRIESKEIIKRFRKVMNSLASACPTFSPYIINFKNETDLEKWCKRINIEYGTFLKSLGTVGGGNHFSEYDINEELGKYCITIHCGSRNLGLKVYKYWHKIANNPKKSIKQNTLEGDDFKGYIVDIALAQEYARINHDIIIDIITNIYKKMVKGCKIIDNIFTMHNYIDYNALTPILRKGAIRSYKGEQMIIPFNMRDGIAVCEGKSNEDWNFTAPHGAGRIMSRAKAKEILNVEEYKKQLVDNNVYSMTANETTLDEAPDAYKPMNEIVKLIEPTVDILYFMKPKMNIKAAVVSE